MKLIDVIEGQPLQFYLDKEAEYAVKDNEPCVFTWIVPPTVIYGRHQLLEQEVNTDYCQRHKIDIVQRNSGGGCVYADRGNLMLSYIAPNLSTRIGYDRYMSMVSGALRHLGYPAVTTEHNDILVNGRKVCGTACYAIGKGSIVHGSILYDVNIEALEQAITPSAAKLAKHAVASVRQRVINLREIIDHGSTDEFRCKINDYIKQYI